MITVPLWLFATLCGVAGLALLGVPAAYVAGRRAAVDEQLDREWLRQTNLPLPPPTDRQADRGQQNGAT